MIGCFDVTIRGVLGSSVSIGRERILRYGERYLEVRRFRGASPPRGDAFIGSAWTWGGGYHDILDGRQLARRGTTRARYVCSNIAWRTCDQGPGGNTVDCGPSVARSQGGLS